MWGRRDAPPGARRISDPPLRAAAGSRLCPRWLSAGTPGRRLHPIPSAPCAESAPVHSVDLCAGLPIATLVNLGLVRRKPGTGPGRAGAGLLPADPAGPAQRSLPILERRCERLRPPLAPWNLLGLSQASAEIWKNHNLKILFL